MPRSEEYAPLIGFHQIDDEDRQLLATLKHQCLTVAGCSQAEARRTFAREIALLDRLMGVAPPGSRAA